MYRHLIWALIVKRKGMQDKTTYALFGLFVVSLMGSYWAGVLSQTPAESDTHVSNQITPQPLVNSIGLTMPEKSTEQQTYNSLSDILTLTSDFEQTRELYQLAARSDLAALEELILEANNLTNISDQNGIWMILFSRYVELDPERAVERAGSSPFIENHLIDDAIWRSWGRLDLKSAVHYLSSLTPYARKEHATQVLYKSIGTENNLQAKLIEQTVGIKPGWPAKMDYTLALAARSPERAIKHVNAMTPGDHQRALAYQLAQFLAKGLSIGSLDFTSSFSSIATRARYKKGVFRQLAVDDPELVLDRWINDVTARRPDEPIVYAFEKMAEQDLDKAQEYFEQVDEPNTRSKLARLVVIEMASRDLFYDAIKWAEQQQKSGLEGFVDRALRELVLYNVVSGFESNENKQRYLAIAIGRMAEWDLQAAIDRVDSLPDGAGKMMANSTLLAGWIKSDAKGAFAYAVANHEQMSYGALQQFSKIIAYIEPELVLQGLSKVDNRNSNLLLGSFAESLIKNHSLEEIQYLLSSYQDKKIHMNLQASLVSRLARDDFQTAYNLALSIPSGVTRDTAMVSLVYQVSQENPAKAAQALANIKDSRYRSQGVHSIASDWYAENPSEALRWLYNLPKAEQAQAIMAMTLSSKKYDERLMELSGSIESKEVRQNAQRNLLYRVQRDDPQRALQMSKDLGVALKQ